MKHINSILKLSVAGVAIATTFFIFIGGVTGYRYVLLVEAARENDSDRASFLISLGAPANPNEGVNNWHHLTLYSDAPIQTAARN